MFRRIMFVSVFIAMFAAAGLVASNTADAWYYWDYYPRYGYYYPGAPYYQVGGPPYYQGSGPPYYQGYGPPYSAGYGMPYVLPGGGVQYLEY